MISVHLGTAGKAFSTPASPKCKSLLNRSIPEEELRAIYWTMEKIFTCNMSSLPPAMLAHTFWFLFRSEITHGVQYTDCLQSRGVNARRALHECHRHIASVCGRRFGEIPGAASRCRSVLWADAHPYGSGRYVPNCERNRRNLTAEDVPDRFKDYYSCLARIAPALTECAAEHLDGPCKRAGLRAMKTVRANMKAGERVLASHRNALLVHAYRDPRGAVSSRLRYRWSQGLGDADNATKEALLYCSQVLSDVRRRVELENRGHRDRITELVYDAYVEEPLKNMMKIYRFIGVEPPRRVREEYAASERSAENGTSKYIANKWRSCLTPEQENIVLKTCAQFYKETTHRWNW